MPEDSHCPCTVTLRALIMSGAATKLAKDRATADGIGTPKNPVKYLNQDFEQLQAQCLASNTLFKDDQFPACPSALGYKELGPFSAKTQGIVWKRPTVRRFCVNF